MRSSVQLVSWASCLAMGVGMATLLPRTDAIAQDDSCYMVTTSGRSVNLEKLCGSGSASPTAAGASTATAPAPTNGVFQAQIKRRLGGIPVIDVTFNNKRTYEMIVDTGASGTLITRSMARALRIPVIGQVQSSIADGSTVVFQVGRINSMSINGAEVKNIRVAIADRMEIGLLGHDFFNNYDVKIKRDVVEFYARN